jgi:alginate O-acetyltransferase complex protein AlgI
LKVLFADSFEKICSPLVGHNFTFLGCWLWALAYSFQLYLDFSGYSLMAIGIGLCLGFPFLDNFREPYQSVSITDFWRRWHISLSTWLRDYLYIPLGGNQAGSKRSYINLMITMLLGGVWHGANSTYVIWGIYHGGLLVFERWMKSRGRAVNSRLLTFVLVVVGWVYFRSPTPHVAERTLNAMAGLNDWGAAEAVSMIVFGKYYALMALLGLGWVFLIEPRVRDFRLGRSWHELSVERVPATVLALTTALMLWSLICSVADRNSPFLYFQF